MWVCVRECSFTTASIYIIMVTSVYNFIFSFGGIKCLFICYTIMIVFFLKPDTMKKNYSHCQPSLCCVWQHRRVTPLENTVLSFIFQCKHWWFVLPRERCAAYLDCKTMCSNLKQNNLNLYLWSFRTRGYETILRCKSQLAWKLECFVWNAKSLTLTLKSLLSKSPRREKNTTIRLLYKIINEICHETQP